MQEPTQRNAIFFKQSAYNLILIYRLGKQRRQSIGLLMSVNILALINNVSMKQEKVKAYQVARMYQTRLDTSKAIKIKIHIRVSSIRLNVPIINIFKVMLLRSCLSAIYTFKSSLLVVSDLNFFIVSRFDRYLEYQFHKIYYLRTILRYYKNL